MLIRRDRLSKGNDIITVYRPMKVSELIGNALIKQSINSYMASNNLPHTILFSGPSGCGKTTVARIIAAGLNCEATTTMTSEPCLECDNCKSIIDGHNMAVIEVNVGKDSGKADVDSVIKHASFAPMGARHKVIIFDEAHKLTTAAKDMLLKPTEDTYNHVYTIFCTDEPEKLINTKKKDDPFLRRCTWLKLGYVDDYDMYDMLNDVTTSEGIEFSGEVLNLIVDKAAGVPSNALKYLGMCATQDGIDLLTAKSLIGDTSFLEDSEDIRGICSIILKSSHDAWEETCRVLGKLLKTNSPESIRIGMGGYFTKCLQSKNSQTSIKASKVLDILLEPLLFDTATSRHKLYNMLYKCVNIGV